MSLNQKVAFINAGLADGGAERVTAVLVNQFEKEKNFDTILISAEKGDSEYPLMAGVKRECILKKRFFRDSWILRNYLKENEVDVAIAIGVYPNLCACLANIWLKTKIIISERNAPKQDHLSVKTKMLRWALYRFADFYVFQTKEAQQFYSKNIRKRSAVIHNPVLENLPQRELGVEKVIVAVGRLQPQKNYPMLIRAFAEVRAAHPEYRLRIYGKGREAELLDYIRQVGLSDTVDLMGFSLNVHEEIKHADIYVLSSDFEGMPNALVEAMAMGFPVVSTDCPSGGPAELIEDGVNGLLTPAGDSGKMAEKLIYLIEHEECKERMGMEAGRIRETHSVDRIARRWGDVIMGVGR